ncbi:hypothetical protein C500_06586 [Natrialba magadii ATCC 43099]|nr:hypothetical protein C500_06586 [Natrialba magadii ATCC 43099]
MLPRDPPILSCIEIVNVDNQSHTVHIRVEYENEEVLFNSYTIDGREENGQDQQKWISQDWPDKPSQFRVHMRMDADEDWITFESEEKLGEHAIQIAYWIGSDGNGIPVWEPINTDDYTQDCNESIMANPVRREK